MKHWHARRHRRFRRPRRLFWRVYGYGLLLLVIVALSAGVAGRVFFETPNWDAQARVARYVDTELGPLVEQPERLAEKLAVIHDIFGVDVGVYGPTGARIAAAGSDVPDALAEVPQTPRSVSRRGPRHDYAVPLAGGRAYAIASVRFGSVGVRWPLMLGLVLLVLALVSAPLARSIVRPLERIAETARALGSGDLSARTGMQRADEVGDLARAVDDMAARIERLVASEKELLANVSHELRTPLARIRVALELAEEDAEGYRAHLGGIAGDLAELEALIEQVLMTARLDLASGPESALAIERAPIQVEDLVASVVKGFGERHPGRALVTDVAPDLAELVGDGRLLKRVLANLTDNAAKYAPAEAGPIEINAHADGEALRLCVRDRGPGVTPDDLPRLFEPFFRADRSRERGTGGVGLGLALCRRIVVAHGGSIEARLRDGGGLEVVCTIPMATDAS